MQEALDTRMCATPGVVHTPAASASSSSSPLPPQAVPRQVPDLIALIAPACVSAKQRGSVRNRQHT
jgi:hypothetical protein